MAAPAMAEDFPVHLPDGATWTITAEHSRSVEGDRPQAWSLTTTKRLSWRAGRGGQPATLTVTPLSAVPGSGSPPELARARSLAVPAKVAVDEDLMPQAIVNTAEVRAEFAKLVPDAANGPAELVDASIMAMVASETAQAARLQGLSLNVGKPISAAGSMASPFGGGPINVTETAELESYSAPQHRAVLVWSVKADPTSFRDALSTMLAASMRSDPRKLAEAKAGLASLSATMENVCRGEVDTTTGLATHVECTQTEVISQDGKSQRNTERWLITETQPETR
jgi:hypothetical protein